MATEYKLSYTASDINTKLGKVDRIDELSDEIGGLSDEIAVERARITNLTTLPEGSTTGDAELIDIRVGANGIIYPSAGDAVRGQIKPIAGIITDLRNLYDGVSWSDYGYTLNTTTGEVVEGSANYSVSDFIPVEPNSTYTVNSLLSGCCYDADKNRVSAFWGKVFTIPSTACYVRISIGYKVPSASLKELYLVKGSYAERPDDIGNVKVEKLQIDTNNIKNRSIDNSKVEFDSIAEDKLSFVKSNRNYCKGIGYETDVIMNVQGFVSANSGTSLSDYIPVKSGTEYIFSNNIHGIIMGYTEEKVPIGSISKSGTYGGSFTTQENCKYIRFCTSTTLTNQVTLFEATADQTQPDTFTMEGLKIGIDNLGADVLGSVKPQLSSILGDLIFTTETKSVKLIGDSITHGMGSSDFAQSTAESDFLFNAGTFPQYRNYGVKCWGGMLKEYLESKFDCTVTNNGASGATIQQLVDNWDAIVSADDDVIICMIGTNDRNNTLTTIYQSVVALYEKAQANNQRIIFMSAPPTSVENEEQFNACHMEDIDNLYNYVNNTFNVGYISVYKTFLNYCREHSITVDSLLADGIHPNDTGYQLMFEIVLEALGFGRKRDGATW